MINPNIARAVKFLQNTNYAGYFETMNKIVPSNLRPIYQELKNKFLMDDISWNFYQRLEILTKEVATNLPKNLTVKMPYNDNLAGLITKSIEQLQLNKDTTVQVIILQIKHSEA